MKDALTDVETGFSSNLNMELRRRIGRRIFLIGGPGGAGKDTVKRAILQYYGHIVNNLVRTTTRPSRANEKEGVDYYFVEQKSFVAKERSGEMVTVDIYNGHYYGIEKEALFQTLLNCHKLVLGVGGICSVEVKQEFPEATLIYLVAPEQQLEERLRLRGESEAAIQAKMAEAKKELALEPALFDHTIDNSNSRLSETINQVCQLMGLPVVQSITGQPFITFDQLLERHRITLTQPRPGGLHTNIWGTGNGKVVKIASGKYQDNRLGKEAGHPMTEALAEYFAYSTEAYYNDLKHFGVKVVPEHTVSACLYQGKPCVCEIATDCGSLTLEDSIKAGQVEESVNLILKSAVRFLLGISSDFLPAGIDLKPSNFSQDGTFLDYIPGRVRLSDEAIHTLVEFPQPTEPTSWRGKYYRYFVPTGVLRDLLLQVCRINPDAREVAKQALYRFLCREGTKEILDYFLNSPAELIGKQLCAGQPVDTELIWTLGNKHPDEYPELCLRDIAFEIYSVASTPPGMGIPKTLKRPKHFVRKVYKLRGNHNRIKRLIKQAIS